MRIYLQTAPEGRHPPRFCLLTIQQDLLEGWTLVREMGYQGYAGQVKRWRFPTREEAERSLIESRDSQVKRGYRVVFSEGQPNP
jgi:predicted DNA-binding WGR domain protein